MSHHALIATDAARFEKSVAAIADEALTDLFDTPGPA